MKKTLRSIAGIQFAPARLLVAAVIAAGFLLGSTSLRADPTVYPPNSNRFGNDYGGWSAAWWQWTLSHPVEGHPGLDTPDFDVTSGQSGDVWFLGGPFFTVERTCTIPAGKALFIGLAASECSSLELPPFYGETAKEQRVIAKFWSDHIINVSFEIDGEVLPNIEKYRAVSPQFTFTAPSPWIFGEVGGTGTAVGDGYYVFLSPMAAGQHTIRFSAIVRYTAEVDGFDFDLPVDMTYHLTVE